jgi:hypothetical protein
VIGNRELTAAHVICMQNKTGDAEADAPLLSQEGATAEGFLKLPPRSQLPSYKQVLEHYEIVAEVTPQTHKERCSRCGLVVLRKKKPTAA